MTATTHPNLPELSEERMRHLLTPPSGPVRVVIDTDTHNEIDDQFALTWALLSPQTIKLEGVYAEPYSFVHHRAELLAAHEHVQRHGGELGSLSDELSLYSGWLQGLYDVGTDPHDVLFVEPAEGMELSYQEILRVFDKLDADSAGLVYRGSERYLPSLEEPLRTPATDALIKAALGGGDDPLYVVAIGCITNVASAILLEPEIINHIVVVWTSAYPSFSPRCNRPSLNLVQDVTSSRFIFDCGVPHVYLPGYYIGAQLGISLPEMERWVRGKGAIGDYLYHLYTHNPIYTQRGVADHFGRSWIIWDIINIAWLLNPDWVPTELVRSPKLDDDLYWQHDPDRHLMREAYEINRNAIYRDFFRKLEKAP